MHKRLFSAGFGLLMTGALTGCTTPPTANVGDCLDSDAFLNEEVSSLPTIDCDDPHDSEVYFTFNVDGDDKAPYPGQEVIEELAEARCIDAFDTFVGTKYNESELWASYVFPQVDSWERSGDREVICFLISDDPVTGTLMNSRI